MPIGLGPPTARWGGVELKTWGVGEPALSVTNTWRATHLVGAGSFVRTQMKLTGSPANVKCKKWAKLVFEILTLSKSLAQVVLCEVHAVEKSMFPVKPDGLEVVWPDGPPYQAAGLVEDLSNDTHPPLHILYWSCGGRQGGQGLARAVRGNAFARPRRTYRSTTSDD